MKKSPRPIPRAAVHLAACFTMLAAALPVSATDKPNFVIILTDDQGYGDLGCFGSKAIREGDWKLLVKPTGGKNEPTLMLFNLAEDIGEKNNLATQHPALVERLPQRMLELDATIEAEARPAWNKP